VGHREDLLAGAKRCLLEKGYMRTTARDIVAASGTNLASIGYHYGSKEALLNQALFEAIGEWGDQVEAGMAGTLRPDASPLERFQAFWTQLLASFPTHSKLWAATFEIYPQLDRMPDLQKLIIMGNTEARRSWALMFHGIDASVDPRTARLVGSLYQALLAGMIAQHLTDPENAPTAAELTEALRIVATGVLERAGTPSDST
jgi:AcrR family transcriptional regulator